MQYPALMIDDWVRLKEQWEHCPAQSKRLLIEGERELAQPVPSTHPAMSITFMALYMTNLALLWKLTGERKYLDGAQAWMDAVSRYKGWGSDPKNIDIDLSASWVLWGLSCALDWLYEDVTEEGRKRYIDAIQHHLSIFLDFVHENRGKRWVDEYWQNHNWINMTGIAAAGYFLHRHGLDDLGAITLTETDFRTVFSLLAEDGSNYEGCCYWRYGGMWLFLYAWLYRGEGGCDYFQKSGYLKHTFSYRLAQISPDLRRNINFGDTHDLFSSHPACIYYLKAREYHDGHAQYLGNLASGPFLAQEASESKVHPGILPEAGLEFIFYDPNITEQSFEDLPCAFQFPDLGLVSVRSSWKSDAVVVSSKCGCPGGLIQWTKGWKIAREHDWHCMSLGHQHPDNLAYQLIVGDHYLIADDGYNRKILASHHSVPLVDGRYADVEGVSDVWMASAKKRIEDDPSYKPDEAMRASTSALLHENGLYTWEVRSEKTYPLELGMTRASRFFATDVKEFLCMVTILHSRLAHTYTLVTNTFEEPVQEGSFWLYSSSGVRMKVVSDCGFTESRRLQTVSAIMTPQEPDKVTRVDQHSQWLSSKNPVNSQVFVQVFSLHGKADVTLEGRTVVLDANGVEYRFQIPEDDEGEVTRCV